MSNPIGFTEEKLEKMSKDLTEKAKRSVKTWKKISNPVEDVITKSTKKAIKKLMIQGDHKRKIQALFEEIIQAAKDEFTEDNVPTRISFLHEIFIEAAREKWNEEFELCAERTSDSYDPKHMTRLLQSDIEIEYLDQLLQDKELKPITGVYLARCQLRNSLSIEKTIEILRLDLDRIKDMSPALYQYLKQYDLKKVCDQYSE